MDINALVNRHRATIVRVAVAAPLLAAFVFLAGLTGGIWHDELGAVILIMGTWIAVQIAFTVAPPFVRRRTASAR